GSFFGGGNFAGTYKSDKSLYKLQSGYALFTQSFTREERKSGSVPGAEKVIFREKVRKNSMYTLLTETIAEDIQKEVTEQTGMAVQFLDENLPKLVDFAFQVVLALVVFFVGRVVINWVRKLVRASIERSNADKGVEQFVDSCLKAGLYVLLILS